MEIETPSDEMNFLAYVPLGADWHFGYISQTHPEIYGTKPMKLLFSISSNPLKNWGNRDEMALFLKSFEYVIGVNIYMDEATDFYDLFIPESSFLERDDPLPHSWLGHRTPNGLDVSWVMSSRLRTVPAIDGAPMSLEIAAEVADRAGFNDTLVERLNAANRVSEEFSVPKDEKLDPKAFVTSVYQSILGEEFTYDWLRENGCHVYPRKLEEVYIWHDGKPGRLPIYLDFMLEAKEKVQKNTAARGWEWDFQDFEPLPSWKPGPEFYTPDPDYDIFPVYWTNALNTDLWQVQNAWLAERTADDPNGFFIEMNTKTAVNKGLRSGDKVRMTGFNGYTAEGVLTLTETIHPECVSVLGGHWDSKTDRLRIAKNKGVMLTDLYPAFHSRTWDFIGVCLDQNVRVKIEKI